MVRKRIASASRAAAAGASTCVRGMLATCSCFEPWVKVLNASAPAITTIAAISASRTLRRMRSARRILFLLRALDALEDQPVGFRSVTPFNHLHPFAGLEILVVLDEALDLLQGDVRQVAVVSDLVIALGQL